MTIDLLRKQPKYDELINYIESKQPKLKYPNRDATSMRNSPYLSQVDGDNSFINLEEQENNIMKQKLIEAVASEDDTLMEKFFETGSLTEDESLRFSWCELETRYQPASANAILQMW
jgi:hypothetical protein